MKTFSLATAILAIGLGAVGLGLVGPAAAAALPDTGEATHGCGEMRVSLLGSLVDDLRGDGARAKAAALVAQARGQHAQGRLDHCEAVLDQLTGFLRQEQVLGQ